MGCRMTEPKEKDWRKARERRMLTISASQVESFDMCKRKWWLNKVRKLPEATSTSQIFGTVLHGVIERYLMADDLGRDRKTGNPIELYPEGWQIAVNRFGELCEHCAGKRFWRHPESESSFTTTTQEQVEEMANSMDGCLCVELSCEKCFGTGKQCEGKINPAEEAAVRRLVDAAIENGVLERLPGRIVEKQFNRAVIKTKCYACGGKKTIRGLMSDTGQEGDVLCPDCGGDGLGCTVMITGFIDVQHPDMVQDHKSTKTMKYAKSPAKLAENHQMLIYGYDAIKSAEERGEPPPKTITLRHNVYCDKENRVKKTTIDVTREHIENHWQKIIRIGEGMSEIRANVERWHEIAEPVNPSYACNAYGGCPFKNICYGQETEDNFEKRLAYQKSIKYTEEDKSMGQVAEVTIIPKLEGKSPMANAFSERLLAVKARNNPVAATTAAPSINPPMPVTATNLVPLTQAPAVVVVSATPAAPVAPVVVQQAAAPQAKSAAFPSIEVPGLGTVSVPPWAQADCSACGGRGFSTKGTSCRICDTKSVQRGTPVSANYLQEPLDNGVIMWIDKQNEDNTGMSFLSGKPQTEITATAKEVLAPAPAPSPAPAPVVETALAPAAPVTQAPVAAAPAAPVVHTITTPTPEPLPEEAQQRRRRRTKKEMEAARALDPNATPEATTTEQSASLGLVLLIGIAFVKGVDEVSVIHLEDAFNHYAGPDYWSMDPFQRRDAFQKRGAEIVAEIGSGFMLCHSPTPDHRAFIEALRPHCAVVMQAVAGN